MAQRVFCYIRVSGRGQIEGDGPERQREAVKAFAERHGLELLGEGFDGGVSGTVDGMERPELAAIMGLCQDGTGIVVEKLDRLARDLMVQEVVLAECRKAGIPVFAADHGELVDLASCDDDPTRKLIRQVMGALAEWDKTSTVLKLRAARQRAKAKTGRCEGAKPYGTTECERQTVQMMIEHYAEHDSYYRTARWLNAMGMVTRSGGKWNRGTVWAILRRYENEIQLHRTSLAATEGTRRQRDIAEGPNSERWEGTEHPVGTQQAGRVRTRMFRARREMKQTIQKDTIAYRLGELKSSVH